jgi:predicted signal transduction protein with EAL and GGDEF domain
VIWSVVGMTPASLSFVAFWITMNCMVRILSWGQISGIGSAPVIVASNEGRGNRQGAAVYCEVRGRALGVRT